MVWRTKVQARVQGLSFLHFFFSYLSLPLLIKFCENGKMLWIEDIIESTHASPFLTNLRIDRVSFVNPYKVLTIRSAFSTLSKCTKWR
jgi:hypothetical protein